MVVAYTTTIDNYLHVPHYYIINVHIKQTTEWATSDEERRGEKREERRKKQDQVYVLLCITTIE